MDYYTSFLGGIIWFAIGALVTYFAMKRNAGSRDPSSLKDEVADLKRFIEAKFNSQQRIMTARRQSDVAPDPVKEDGPDDAHEFDPVEKTVIQADTLEVKADNVEIMSGRSDAPTSGAKTQGHLPGEISNDEVISKMNEQVKDMNEIIGRDPEKK